MVGWMVNALPSPGLLYPRERPCTNCIRDWEGPQGRSGRVRKISSQLGFDPLTVMSVASRYTDSAIPAHYPNQILRQTGKRGLEGNHIELT